MKSNIYEKEEKETFICFDEANPGCIIHTWNKALIAKLERLCREFPEEYEQDKDYNRHGERKFYAKKKYLTFRAPSSRTLSAEQREASRERMKKMRNG